MINLLLTNRKQRINYKANFNTYIKNQKESLKKHSERKSLVCLTFQVKKRLKKTPSTENIFYRKCLFQKQPFLQTSQKRRFVSLPKSDAISRTKLVFEKYFCSRFPRCQRQTMFAMNTQQCVYSKAILFNHASLGFTHVDILFKYFPLLLLRLFSLISNRQNRNAQPSNFCLTLHRKSLSRWHQSSS